MQFQPPSQDQMPEVNVLPMLNVLMGVLGFFVLITLSLSGTQPGGIALPQTGGSAIAGAAATGGEAAAMTLTLGLDRTGQIFMEGRPIPREALVEEVSRYLGQYPQGQVILQADRGLTFQEISPTIQALQSLGSDRIGLAMEP